MALLVSYLDPDLDFSFSLLAVLVTDIDLSLALLGAVG